MRRESGTTVVELLVASGVLLAATAAVFTLVADATARAPYWNDAADLHQRARVAADVIARHLSAASAARPHAALARSFPAIEPRRRSSFLASDSAVTVRHIPEHAAWTTITSDLIPGGGTVAIATHAGCPVGVSACGFSAGADAVILDGSGGWHLLTVDPSGPSELAIMDRVPGRTATFAAGATIVEVVETSLYLDPAARTLRQEGPGEGSFPLVDHVAALTFEYFVDALAPASLASLLDGPLCGSGSLAYDCDLHRVSTVRASLVIAATQPGLRPLSIVVESTRRGMR